MNDSISREEVLKILNSLQRYWLRDHGIYCADKELRPDPYGDLLTADSLAVAFGFRFNEYESQRPFTS